MYFSKLSSFGFIEGNAHRHCIFQRGIRSHAVASVHFSALRELCTPPEGLSVLGPKRTQVHPYKCYHTHRQIPDNTQFQVIKQSCMCLGEMGCTRFAEQEHSTLAHPELDLHKESTYKVNDTWQIFQERFVAKCVCPGWRSYLHNLFEGLKVAVAQGEDHPAGVLLIPPAARCRLCHLVHLHQQVAPVWVITVQATYGQLSNFVHTLQEIRLVISWDAAHPTGSPATSFTCFMNSSS